MSCSSLLFWFSAPLPNLLWQLSAQILYTHVFSVFRLVGLCLHPCGTIVQWIPLLYVVGSGPDHSSSSRQLLDDPLSFLVFVRTSTFYSQGPPPPSRACARTDLEKDGYVCGYACQSVPYVRKCIQKHQWHQFFLLDNVTLLLADVCPSNRKMLPAKNCVSQTQTPYRG